MYNPNITIEIDFEDTLEQLLTNNLEEVIEYIINTNTINSILASIPPEDLVKEIPINYLIDAISIDDLIEYLTDNDYVRKEVFKSICNYDNAIDLLKIMAECTDLHSRDIIKQCILSLKFLNI